MSPHILLVEDDPVALRLLTIVLERAGYTVKPASNGEMAVELLGAHPYDVVVTDIQMGQINGIEVLRVASAQPNPPKVIILTGYGSIETAISALRLGAYDYLLKPCEPPDLLTCVNSALEDRIIDDNRQNALQLIAQGLEQLRSPISPFNTTTETMSKEEMTNAESPEANRYLNVGELCIDRFRYTASFQKQALHVTPIEYALLHCLAEAKGRVLSFSEIVYYTHGYTTDESEAQELLKTHVRRLRRKIDPAYLVNIRGIGYMLVNPTVVTQTS